MPWSRGYRFFSSVISSLGHVVLIHGRERYPGIGVDEGVDEADGAVAEEDVAAGRGVLGPHFVGMAEGVVGGMNDDLGMVANVGPAVSADEAAAAVAVARPGPSVQARAGGGPRHDPYPGLVAQDRAVLADEDGVRQAIGDLGDPRVGIAIERAVDDVGH